MDREEFGDRQALVQACDDLATVPYWIEANRAAVMFELAEMCPSREALAWLVKQVKTQVRAWPSLAELRGMLCTRYDPADGIETYCTLPGFRAEDLEMRYIEREQAELKALPAVELQALLPPGDMPPIGELLKPIPPPLSKLQFHTTPLNAYEIGILRQEVNDERLSAEARAYAQKRLSELERT